MNDPILPPLPPETVDELLSAELDGELDAAAADLGLDPEQARAVVAAQGERYALLGASREALADVAPLDELTRRRLVSAAVGAPGRSATGTRRNPTRLLTVLGGAAALLALVVGIGASLRSSGGADRTASSAGDGGAPSPAAGSTAGEVVDLGDVSEPAALRRAVSSRLAPGGTDHSVAFSSEAADGAETSPAPQAARRDANNAGPNPGSTTIPVPSAAEQLSTASPPAGDARTDAKTWVGGCPGRVSAELGVSDPALLTATAVYGGRPAGVVVHRVDQRVLAVVYALDDCTLLSSQSWTG